MQPHRRIHLVPGQRFERLTVIDGDRIRSYPNGRRIRSCLVRCDCGVEREVLITHLFRGAVRSCGCLLSDHLVERNTRHGLPIDRLYWIWAGMRERCEKTRSTAWANYGGRGIIVCQEWQAYAAFHAWAMANGYSDTLSIDRINNDGNYEPSNCRWATPAEQSRNTRQNRLVTCWGETKVLSDWAKDPRCHLQRQTIAWRLSQGWPTELALTKPTRSHR